MADRVHQPLPRHPLERLVPQNSCPYPLDVDYDGRSLYLRQVFFPLAGEKDGWARLAKNLNAPHASVHLRPATTGLALGLSPSRRGGYRFRRIAPRSYSPTVPT
jgi:hypothetical protein